MQSITWCKQMKFTEKMSLSWSTVTFQQKVKPMSLSSFKLEMEFCGFATWNNQHVEKMYKIYIDDLEEKKSK